MKVWRCGGRAAECPSIWEGTTARSGQSGKAPWWLRAHKHLLSTRCALDIDTEVWRKVLVPTLAELSLKGDTCKTHFYFRAGSVMRLWENRGAKQPLGNAALGALFA